jgi:hypothetical protein
MPGPPLGPLPKVHVACGGREGDAARARAERHEPPQATAEPQQPSEPIPVPTAILATEPCATSVKERERARSRRASERASKR